MNRFLITLPILFVLTLGLSVRSQADSRAQNGLTTYDTSKLIGLTVKARDGVKLGRIFDLVADSDGRLDFAIVSEPGFEEFSGRFVVVPFAALAITKADMSRIRVVFNEDKEKFYEGPDWSHENLADLKQAASVDRYYGIEPSWTEAGRAPDWMLLRILDGRRWDPWGERPQK